MTNQEFMRQIWRPFDTVELEGGIIGRVTSVCFPTKSVKVTINKDVHDWITHDCIVGHISVTGDPDDLAVIEDLHDKLMKAEKLNEDLQVLARNNLARAERAEKLNDELRSEYGKMPKVQLIDSIHKLTKAFNVINANTIEKKKTIERLENSLNTIESFVQQLNNLSDECI
jgi:preprotein translocase subunit YajC